MESNYATTNPQSHSEGTVARTIEQQTAKLPSDTFLWMAIGAMAASASLQAMGNKNASLFVGQWAPAFLIFGLYNKLVKQHGSDRLDQQHGAGQIGQSFGSDRMDSQYRASSAAGL
jgi:hypothetical protein